MHSLGALLRDAGKLDEALRYLVQARDGLRRTKDLDDIETMTAMVDLAELSMLLKQEDSATLLSQTAEWFLQTRLIANPETLRAVESVASLLVRNKQSAEAERLVEAVLDRLRAEVGDENPSSLIATRTLASIYTATARPVDAERLWRKALSGQRTALGAKHPETLGTTVLFGEFLMSQGREAEAEDLFLKALRTGREALDRNHMATAVALGYLAGIHVSKGELKKAESYLIETAEITRIRFGPDHGLTVGADSSVAILLLFEADYARAEDYLRDCCAFWVRNHADHEDRWRSELRLGLCLLAQKKLPEAQSRLLAFYAAMDPRAGRVSIATPQDLGWLIWRITQLRDEKGGPWNDPSLSRLRVDAGLQAIVQDLQFPEDPLAPP
jgi:tetratricopeptide (TPR) repeat protein